jgi:hypothetical protein
MNTYLVKSSGLRWIVRKDGDTSWSPNSFAEQKDAIAYAEVLAKSDRPSRIQIFSLINILTEIREFPAL